MSNNELPADWPKHNFYIPLNRDPDPDGDGRVTPIYVLDNTMTQKRAQEISEALQVNDLPTAAEHLVAGGEGVMLVEIFDTMTFYEKTSILEYLRNSQTPLLMLWGQIHQDRFPPPSS